MDKTNRTEIMKRATILVNGEFPKHSLPLRKLQKAQFLICCDGALNALDSLGIIPDLIIGDMDSAREDLKAKYAHLILQDREQNSNDMTKAVRWAIKNKFEQVRIIGAGGLREDHCIANSFLMFSYYNKIDVKMYTNHGVFSCAKGEQKLRSFKGQQVSLFAPYSNTVEESGLMYSLVDVNWSDLWMGTLNESTGNEFTIKSEQAVLIFRSFQLTN